MGVINLAHGSFYMIGAYLAFALAPSSAMLGGRFFATLLVGAACSRSLLGYVLEWAFFSFLYQRDHLQQVLMTYGLILVFEELRSAPGRQRRARRAGAARWLAGSDRARRPDDATRCTGCSSRRCAWCSRSGCTSWSTRTRLGMMIRAGASNRDMVQSLGIDIKLLYRVVFAAGVALAALAGMIAAPVSSVYPGMGSQVLIICFVVVVIGGIGSITRRAGRGAAGRLRRHLRQGVLRRMRPASASTC